MIGVGIDVVEIARFRRALDRTPSMRERLFTATELAYVAPKVDPVPSLAARFAAREAVMKALGLGLGAFGFHEAWVEVEASGARASSSPGGHGSWPSTAAWSAGTSRSATTARSPWPSPSPSDALTLASDKVGSGGQLRSRGVIPIVTPEEMAAIDAAAPEPVEVLIERAGAAVARMARQMLGGTYGRTVNVIAGKGNNGNDGRAAAASLAARGVQIRMFDAADSPSGLPDADLVIDAAYGTGFRGQWRAPRVGKAPVLAVDIPSGVNGLTGEAGRGVLAADRTVTFAALKPGLLIGAGRWLAGDVEVVDIGLDTSCGARPPRRAGGRGGLVAAAPAVGAQVDAGGARRRRRPRDERSRPSRGRIGAARRQRHGVARHPRRRAERPAGGRPSTAPGVRLVAGRARRPPPLSHPRHRPRSRP